MTKKIKNTSALKEKEGVPQPNTLNIEVVNKLRARKKKELTVEGLASEILKANQTALSQAITIIESKAAKHQLLAKTLIEKCLPRANKSIRIGITGVPGVGKSTFIESFGKLLISKGKRVAALTVDPSSSISKGSILGDKTRMEELVKEPNAFIRPSASGSTLGGVARKTRETIILCEAAGFDVILIETVGVGQSETAVHSMTDFFLLLKLAGAGDELQGIKRGIMEMADGIVINKADGDNIGKANIAQNHFKNALHLFPLAESGWSPEVLTYSGYYDLRIGEIWEMVDRYIEFVRKSGYFDVKRNKQSTYWMYETINERLRNDFYRNEKIEMLMPTLERQVLGSKKSSFIAAKEAIDAYYGEL